jgi:hypothetical protein
MSDPVSISLTILSNAKNTYLKVIITRLTLMEKTYLEVHQMINDFKPKQIILQTEWSDLNLPYQTDLSDLILKRAFCDRRISYTQEAFHQMLDDNLTEEQKNLSALKQWVKTHIPVLRSSSQQEVSFALKLTQKITKASFNNINNSQTKDLEENLEHSQQLMDYLISNPSEFPMSAPDFLIEPTFINVQTFPGSPLTSLSNSVAGSREECTYYDAGGYINKSAKIFDQFKEVVFYEHGDTISQVLAALEQIT